MKLSNCHIPLAIALSTAVALTAGCTPTETADDRAAQTAEPVETAPADTDPGYDDATPDPVVGDGVESDQPGSDTWITTKVKTALLADTDVAGLNIDVDTVNGVVTLSGRVDQQSQIEHATRIARDVKGVTEVQTTGLTVGNN